LRSLERCRALGLPSGTLPVRAALPLTPVQQRLLTLARSSIEDLYQLLDRPGFAVLLADAGAMAIDLEGDPDVVQLAHTAGLQPPVELSEASVGTNAVDLALREAQPFQTTGDEHYNLRLRRFTIAAAPFFDAEGRLLGALAILAGGGTEHPYALGLAIAAAQALHNQLRADYLLTDANDQLAELYATLETISEGLIFIGASGDIKRINRRAAEMLGINPRAVPGHPLDRVLVPPSAVQLALQNRTELSDQELLWQGHLAALPALTSIRPVWDSGRRYLGALITLRPAQSFHRLVQQVVGAQAQFTFRDIIGQSPAMVQALHHAHLAANGEGSVVLRGEPGVGKEIVAQAIHNASRRSGGPFVRVNCSAVPRPLLGPELFGVEGAVRPAGPGGRPGKIELASSGTLYLEEVDTLPIDLQTALLRVIEMRRMLRTGSTRPIPVDVRIIATGNTDLDRLISEGRFRADLAARLSSFTVDLPPLRARGDDLLLLIGHLLLMLSERAGRPIAFAPAALQALRAYPWPGNVRELELTLERLIQSSEKSVLTLDDLPPAIGRGAVPIDLPHFPTLADHQGLSERDAIIRAGRKMVGHLGRTAAQLGISRTTLWRKMQHHGISRADFGSN
jgi:transcriptional regulator of acetoin/glycerol metabolism